MAKDIDQLAVEITQANSLEELTKGLPPSLAAKFRAWMRSLHPKFHKDPRLAAQARQMVAQKMEELASFKTLKKNEAQVSAYNDGVVRLDFGADVPDGVKKAAMAWAKRRGLKPIEASLQKSSVSPSFIVYAPETPVEVAFQQRIETKKWSV